MNIYSTFVVSNFYSKSSIETIRTQFKSSAWAACALACIADVLCLERQIIGHKQIKELYFTCFRYD
jgi:hypothetical protein